MTGVLLPTSAGVQPGHQWQWGEKTGSLRALRSHQTLPSADAHKRLLGCQSCSAVRTSVHVCWGEQVQVPQRGVLQRADVRPELTSAVHTLPTPPDHTAAVKARPSPPAEEPAHCTSGPRSADLMPSNLQRTWASAPGGTPKFKAHPLLWPRQESIRVLACAKPTPFLSLPAPWQFLNEFLHCF